MPGKLQPYDSLRDHGQGPFTLDGDWNRTTFRRRMTVVRLPDGTLFVHNAIRLREEDYALLDRLGPVRWIVAPNAFHGSEAHFYKLRYPDAKLLVSRGCEAAVRRRAPVDGILPLSWPAALRPVLDCREFRGTRWLNETVFFHAPSRTLILTDLVFHLRQEVHGAERVFFKINNIYKRFGPSRLFRHLFVRDHRDAARSLATLLEWDFDRVVMNHGDVLESGGRSLLRAAFEESGIAPLALHDAAGG